MKDFDKIVRYLNEIKGYKLSIEKGEKFRFAMIPISTFSPNDVVVRNVVFDEFMNLDGQVDDVVLAYKIVKSAKDKIHEGLIRCQKCIDDGGGCGHIDRDEMFYMFCED